MTSWTISPTARTGCSQLLLQTRPHPSNLDVGDAMFPVDAAHDARDDSPRTNLVAVLHALLQQRLHGVLPPHWGRELPQHTRIIPQNAMAGCSGNPRASRHSRACSIRCRTEWGCVSCSSPAATNASVLRSVCKPVVQACLLSCRGRHAAAHQHWR